ncbi:MAG: hypothetical protein AAGJ35_02070, partial [Myxococcota bacterium]
KTLPPQASASQASLHMTLRPTPLPSPFAYPRPTPTPRARLLPHQRMRIHQKQTQPPPTHTQFPPSHTQPSPTQQSSPSYTQLSATQIHSNHTQTALKPRCQASARTTTTQIRSSAPKTKTDESTHHNLQKVPTSTPQINSPKGTSTSSTSTPFPTLSKNPNFSEEQSPSIEIISPFQSFPDNSPSPEKDITFSEHAAISDTPSFIEFTSPPTQDMPCPRHAHPLQSKVNLTLPALDNHEFLPQSKPAPALSREQIESMAPAGKLRTNHQEYHHQALFETVQELFTKEDYEGTLKLLDLLQKTHPLSEHHRLLYQKCIILSQENYLHFYQDGLQIPFLRVELPKIQTSNINHRTGFLLSLIDGHSTLDAIRAVSNFDELEFLQIFYKLYKQGLIGFLESEDSFS